jgi:hypothetical protein
MAKEILLSLTGASSSSNGDAIPPFSPDGYKGLSGCTKAHMLKIYHDPAEMPKQG